MATLTELRSQISASNTVSRINAIGNVFTVSPYLSSSWGQSGEGRHCSTRLLKTKIEDMIEFQLIQVNRINMLGSKAARPYHLSINRVKLVVILESCR